MLKMVASNKSNSGDDLIPLSKPQHFSGVKTGNFLPQLHKNGKLWDAKNDGPITPIPKTQKNKIPKTTIKITPVMTPFP